MTAENVFRFYRAYKFYYQGKYDLMKYGPAMKSPPLINQADRRFYYRISQKLADEQIHGLFTVAFFHHPNAYVADLVSPDALQAGMQFAARAENGRTLLEHDCYTLRKHLATVNLDEWLYGEWMGTQRVAIPECLQMVINGELPLDLAAILLLVPRKELDYHWTAQFSDGALGAGEWIGRLKCADQLIRLQRPGWRQLAWSVSEQFWTELAIPSLAPEHRRVQTTLDI